MTYCTATRWLRTVCASRLSSWSSQAAVCGSCVMRTAWGAAPTGTDTITAPVDSQAAWGRAPRSGAPPGPDGTRARRGVLADPPVHHLAQQVGVASVPAVLLDQVADEPAQAGVPALVVGEV